MKCDPVKWNGKRPLKRSVDEEHILHCHHFVDLPHSIATAVPSLSALLPSSLQPLSLFLCCLPLKIDSGLAVMRCTVGFLWLKRVRNSHSASQRTAVTRVPGSSFWSLSVVWLVSSFATDLHLNFLLRGWNYWEGWTNIWFKRSSSKQFFQKYYIFEISLCLSIILKLGFLPL